ncbi:hypothetical protein QBC33DRAFT_264750 [Phialemonium atrogriseum]|uniref:Uncharacterized protein n=1 Tax=Phialemonium atrogriseum TaxID=1093897 RepID=A0AAJ0FPL2_9PEZI|nr:uncharacterized protein QBC33DRAFT_264750 [Phialemonium atrogriseum]KAK1770383.1 hypothetical protein QBC33DRAFT_264750 [Phialemonium atrogriseum]
MVVPAITLSFDCLTRQLRFDISATVPSVDDFSLCGAPFPPAPSRSTYISIYLGQWQTAKPSDATERLSCPESERPLYSTLRYSRKLLFAAGTGIGAYLFPLFKFWTRYPTLWRTLSVSTIGSNASASKIPHSRYDERPHQLKSIRFWFYFAFPVQPPGPAPVSPGVCCIRLYCNLRVGHGIRRTLFDLPWFLNSPYRDWTRESATLEGISLPVHD